jgi:tetratricopeptide (TPR) repeat protein
MSRLALAIVILALSGASAHADDRARARQHARRAVALYEVGRFDAALVEFEQAYVLYPTDTLLFNLAQTHRKLEHCREALDLYKRLLERSPASDQARAVRKLLPELETACKTKDAAPRGVRGEGAEATDPAIRSAAAPVAAVTVEQSSIAAVPVDAGAPAEGRAVGAPPTRRIFGAFAGGALHAPRTTAIPFGVSAGFTSELERAPVEVGAHLVVAGYAWSGDGYRGTSSVVDVTLTVGRALEAKPFVLRVDGGVGATILSGLSSGNPLLARGRGVPGGTFAAPRLEISASAERMFASSWRALVGVRAGIAHGGDALDGALVSFGVLAGIGRSL